MGACVAHKHSKSLHELKNDLRTPPEDTQSFNPEFNPTVRTLKFEALLSNVKIQGDLQDPLGIHFRIPDNILDVHFAPLDPQGNQEKTIKWKAQSQTFKFTANEYDIRRKTFEVTLLKNTSQNLESIQINLYRILTGPIKHSFKLPLAKDKFIQVMFDLKISESLKIQAHVQAVQLKFNGKYPGESFNFTLEWVLSENGKNVKKITTRPSPSSFIPLDKENLMNELNEECQSPVSVGERKVKRSSQKKREECDNCVSWRNEGFLPEISFNLTVDEIIPSYVWFHCWKIEKPSGPHQKEVLFRFANFRVALKELLQSSKQKMVKDSLVGKDFRVQINEDLWSNGAIIGQCEMEVRLVIPNYIKQVYGLVRSEKGIVDTGIAYAEAEQTSLASQSFDKLKNLHNQLLALKEKPPHLQNKFFQNTQIHNQQTKILHQITKQLRGIPFTLDMISKEDKKVKELNEKHMIFLQLMNTNYSLLSENNEQLTEECWNFLIYLLKRGEFQLRSIGFSSEQMAEIHKVDLSRESRKECTPLIKGMDKQYKLLKKKVKLSIEFQRLLFSSLINSLTFGANCIDQNNSKLDNGQVFKAYCFMRIPIFRNYLLEQIVRQEDKKYKDFEINERDWLKSGIDVKIKQSQMLKQIQWEEQFYQPLQLKSESQELNEQLREALDKSEWVDEIAKRENLFLHFFYLLIKKYQQIKRRNKIPRFQYIPGYKKLVASLLNQMTSLPLLQYSNSLIKACVVLLKNQDLHQPLLLIIAKKTNFYQASQLIKCISIYRVLLKYLTVNSNFIPASFCYGVFVKVIKKILTSQSANCVAAVIMLIYENYHKFQSEFQTTLTLYLLGSKFNSLFYHWSYVVRSAFHHLLVLRICQNQNLFTYKGNRMQRKLKQNYDTVLKQLNQYNKLYNKTKRVGKKQQIKVYHLRMKHKMWKIKQNQQKIKKELLEGGIQSLKQIKNRISMDQTISQRFNPNSYSKNTLQPVTVLWPEILDCKRIQQINKEKNSPPSIKDLKLVSKSQTQIQQQEGLPQIQAIKFYNKQYTYHQSAKYHGAFSEDEFTLEELTEREKNQVKTAQKQFETINAQIKRKYLQTNELPSLPEQTYGLFDNFKIELQEIQYFLA